MRFLHPEFFWLLLLLPLLAFWRGKKGRAPALEFSNAQIVREVARETKFDMGWFTTALRMLGLSLCIIALARPQFGRGHTEIEASGIDIVLAIDISGSMKALDFKLHGNNVNRIDVVKSVVSEFIDARPNDRIAIIAFAGRPYLVSPLTLDHPWLLHNLERIQIGLVEDGTAIGSAIATSVNRLRDQPSKSKIVILLTDGVNNAGNVSPEAAAEAAHALGIKVYTIGAGIRGEAPIPVRDQFGNERLIPMKVDVDEDILKKIADLTGAEFYRATNTDALKNIYSQIDKLEKTTQKIKKYENYQELFHWALLPALALLSLEVWLSQTFLRRLP